ncbi:phosphoribosyl-AMP cyclohydrolase [Limnobacter humi]|uniref:Phosphoribosyl-AMP cyclohydrolase n=1 Tax=Limnobacter humi TaxID=1778671 RepID=A0ABT1WIY1_9BURK|nr:phosphoribosyl-AMP cyclohydrolase [Limnobacter humi]MCQ8897470.1 phosphoribosyl-AMP cyclohydrolase [Limnobacter humi]
MSKDVVITDNWLDSVAFDDQGLVTVVAQDYLSKRVLMVAWMNRQALEITAKTRFATYFSRSRNKLWHKGEESGNQQKVHDIRLDCDGDVIVLLVEQVGGIACHTGRESCFYYALETNAQGQPAWVAQDPVLKDPAEMYRPSK